MDIIFLSLVFTTSISSHSISEEVVSFYPLWFPREKSLCLLSLVIIVLHVILSDKILRSYCLNDKNLTIVPWRTAKALDRDGGMESFTT